MEWPARPLLEGGGSVSIILQVQGACEETARPEFVKKARL